MNDHLIHDHSSNLPPQPPPLPPKPSQLNPPEVITDQTVVQKRKRSTSTTLTDPAPIPTTTTSTSNFTNVAKRKPLDEYDFDSHEPTKLNPPEIEDVPVKKKVQKAVKRTMKQRVEAATASSSTAGLAARRGRFKTRVGDDAGGDDSDQLEDGNDETMLRTFILGSVRLTCSKDQFKCVECGQTDLKSHYK